MLIHYQQNDNFFSILSSIYTKCFFVCLSVYFLPLNVIERNHATITVSYKRVTMHQRYLILFKVQFWLILSCKLLMKFMPTVLNSDTKDASFILKPPSLKEVELNRRPPRGSTLVFACFLFYLFFHKKASLWVSYFIQSPILIDFVL
jgi:hypothetical protein